MIAISPFASSFPVMSPVAGVQLATAASGMRYKSRDDVLLVQLADGTNIAGVTTTNQMPGTPIPWTRKLIQRGTAQALLVNAGIANVFTGDAGAETVRTSAEAVAEALSITPEKVAIASTGVIGESINTSLLAGTIPGLAQKLNPLGWEEAARAIMTTDTFPKGATRSATIGDTQVTINGIIKGSGMIEPNMATMLGYVFTDATVPATIMQHWLNEVLMESYHAITVDSDTSTSDMVLCFATNQKQHWPIDDPDDPGWQDFREKFKEVHRELAQLVVKDGEGISKLVTIHVQGAKDDLSAHRIAKSIANSPLVKTAIAGEDANWGRIVAAAGKAGEPCNPAKSCVWAGGHLIALNGAPYEEYEEADVTAHMQGREVDLRIDVGVAEGEATVYTCDLTHAYIDINADYRS